MVTLRLSHIGKAEGMTQYEFQGEDRDAAVDEFVMWIANEAFDYRFPPEHIGPVILANAQPYFAMTGPDWSVTFEFTSTIG
jgi:hypothetical protein